MATLTANISSSATILGVSAEVENGYYTIDDEAVYVHGTSRGADGRAFDRKRVSVDRAIAGTTAATHLSGATLTRYYPDSATPSGGGGVTVDNETDPPAEVTTIVAPGWVITGDTAEVVYAVAATGLDDAELDMNVTAEDGDARLTMASMSTTGVATVDINAYSGAQGAQVQLFADDGSGNPSQMVFSATRLYFNGDFTALPSGLAVDRPVLPAVPTAQDIADALVALGLCTQTP